jgi:hypothetical protein
MPTVSTVVTYQHDQRSGTTFDGAFLGCDWRSRLNRGGRKGDEAGERRNDDAH